ncbi:MAG: hypothetical protein KJZ72_19175, partial [Anaerolineales bacterium]|nr:hypothetical protein [Anaerolineales bacterium]
GIRPTYEGLQVAPVIPSAWEGFEVARSYRGVRYEIKVKRRGAGNQIQLEVDGKSITGSIIPFPAEGTKTVQVTAWLGM